MQTDNKWEGELIRRLSIIAGCVLLGACANPLNQLTAERYGQTCLDAQRGGRMEVAEEACRRALINVRIGNLGEEAESQALYELARVKQQVGKHAEAEEFLKQSLLVQERITPNDPLKVGRRLTNLAISLGNQSRFREAWPYLERLIPISEQYTGRERFVVKTVFEKYSDEYRQLGMPREAAQLIEKSKSL